MRRLTRQNFARLLPSGILAAAGLPLLAGLPLAAQEPGRARVASAPAAPGGALPERPAATPLQQTAVSPALEKVLVDWHRRTQGIGKLQGGHRRWTYDMTFMTEKRAEGKFFYEGPDKGRIDVTPVDPKDDRNPPKPGFSLQIDQTQSWICDGASVLQIDAVAKTYEATAIPPQHQGQNIMDGPLPFLFGMPPEKAKQRYDIALVSETPQEVVLAIRPRWREDAANWQKADVRLAKATYLPTAVQLLDPAGTKQTVYSFGGVEINPSNIFDLFKGSPFKPNLYGLKQVQNSAPVQPIGAEGAPSMIGVRHDQAKQMLEARGYKVRIVRGPAAPNPQVVFHVKEQFPLPKQAIEPGGTVTLTLFDQMPAAGQPAASPR